MLSTWRIPRTPSSLPALSFCCLRLPLQGSPTSAVALIAAAPQKETLHHASRRVINISNWTMPVAQITSDKRKH
ncbi:hypothetical protein BO86DRAFT_73460 [Aspergillus japonicus CBS 114.51]|uniref:Uncharacterized protein n=2 Tax=Aspergillus TaxID=5052 RepID=A0A2V5IG69_ASPV1|nr:hypothetical protein BO86DRAFT_73460 [Aspergillus japonicus CBS 114.51]PYI18666.1 hypothetical protein BO99DRAFT_163349 [Aspergillus violaceofuscus CBS 115571]RAH86854.1 hypothetical protein BO86DRAFT_73460 [Aspergillus japonicus CBS 114.51]